MNSFRKKQRTASENTIILEKIVEEKNRYFKIHQ